MTRTTRATGLALALVLPVAAQAAGFATIDANSDGYVTMAEFQGVMPDVSAEAFMQADTNGDGALTEDELSAAQEAGVLPSSDG